MSMEQVDFSEKVICLIKSRRSIRKFKQEKVPTDILVKCIETATLAPSAQNLQPLEYFLVTDPDKLDSVFSCLKWAGYIAPKGDPKEGERPTAYLIVLTNQVLRKSRAENDAGAAIENFIISTWSYGIGTCWIASVDREKLRQLFRIPNLYNIGSVIAIGYPDESPVVEICSGDVRYWKDVMNILHVPKRSVHDILHIDEWKMKN